MRLFVVVLIVVVIDGCRVYRRIPEDGAAYSKRYNFVLRTELDFEDYYADRKLVRSLAYHRNGRKAIEMISSVENPVTVRTDYYYANGQRMRETLLVADTLILENDWYDDGMQRLSFVLGANNHQVVKRWHNNGIKSEESEWVGNKRNGKFVEWDSNGRRVRNEIYRNGVKIR